VELLPFAVSLVAALVLGPALRQSLLDGGHTRENFRGAQLPFPFGVLIGLSAAAALVVLAPLDELTDGDVLRPELLALIAPYVLGVAFLGLVDDALSGPSRGWRGHGAAVLKGGFSTGALKAIGSLGLALLVLRGHEDYLLAVAVLVLATNLFNLLDLRPGRAAKAFVLLGAGLTLGAWDLDPLWALGLFAAPVLAAGLYDLRERVMLGDAGSNVIGALAGLWLVLTLETTGLAVAAAVLLLVTAYGEFRSLNALIERTPVLRHLDSIGRPHA
jgi:UDP-N-acetylmuramyl pentapeptide phosphotransferase/UDP-N-acetylglucosamine-1-phosphate transferase